MIRNTLRRASILIVALIPALAISAPVPWASRTVQISVTGKNVRDVLRDFVSSQRIPATIATDVTGTVTGQFDTTPQQFLDSLAATFGFIWYYDGAVLSINGPNDITRSVLQLDYTTTRELRSALERSQLIDPRFPVRYDELSGTAIVSGPPQYVQLVSDIARRLDSNANRAVGPVVRIFALHHAWAVDRSVQLGDKTIKLPGVASVLSNMYRSQKETSNSDSADAGSGGGAGNVRKTTQLNNVAGGSNNGVLPPLPQNAMIGQNAIGALAASMPLTADAAAGPGAARANVTGNAPAEEQQQRSQDLPVFMADQRTNSILIRDLPERMGQYGPLIDYLDVRPRLIEIEARIIEIDTDALEQLGVDWRAHNSHFDLQTGTGTTAQNSYDGNLAPTFGTTSIGTGATSVNATPAGISLTAVLGDAGRYLLARIYALEQSNLARIDARPKVLTVDNIEAVMDRKTQFFVKVAGYASADLYSVSSGTSLRVLPMVLDDNGKTEIKLDVRIEDGNISTDTTVNDLPIVTTSTITTQAFITQGESLLIAGYQNDQSSIGTSGVPGLSKIPLIGGLFRYKSTGAKKMEKLYLLSPRIIDF